LKFIIGRGLPMGKIPIPITAKSNGGPSLKLYVDFHPEAPRHDRGF
jgi:hypothetical protein